MALKIRTKANKKLRNRFRFVILNDETFEEKFSLTLTKRNVWIFLSVSTFTLVFLTSAAIIYTPLKYFIPGFGDYNYRSQIIQLQFKTDSLQTAMESRTAWIDNLVNIASGNIDTTQPTAKTEQKVDKSSFHLSEPTPDETDLRKQVEKEENYSLIYNGTQSNVVVEEVRQMHAITPVDGFVTSEFDAQKEHFGIDIATKNEAPVKAILDGKVISAAYTIETGYVIEVQHAHNLISIYKHNSRLLKKPGNKVKAGDVIALSGNTGELSSGPHLHFELWYEGKSLNPKDYILF